MLVRAIALSLALLVGIGVIIPLATDTTEAGPRKARKKQVRKYKKYSKGWWRQYRARMKRKRAIQARKRALRLRQLRLARAAKQAKSQGETVAKTNPDRPRKADTTAAAVLPSGDQAPAGWRPAQASPAEVQFRVDNSAGDQVGSASISVVGPATSGADSGRKSVGGVSTTSLRRDVIDRMVRENGSAVNEHHEPVARPTVQ